MAKVILKPIGTPLLDPGSKAGVTESAIEEKRAKIKQGWGKKYQERVRAKSKLTVWERLELLGSPVYPIGTFVDTGSEDKQAPAAGVITAFIQIENRWCMVIANDNTVASGSWWPKTPEKIIRAQEIALKLKIPVIYLVDCSGLYLPEQSKSFPGQKGAGHIFKMNSLLSNAGVPQIAGVFGDCIAGGGYMPIISDKVYMTESAYMVIAGAALIQGAKSQNLSSLDIGGASIHVHISNCADFRVPDDKTCLDHIRQEIAQCNSSSIDYYRNDTQSSKPRFSPDELSSIMPAKPTESYDIRDIISRLVDDSLFWEILEHSGHEIITGIAKISGLYVGIAANVQGLLPHPEKPDQKRPGGILYKEGVAKLATFVRACDSDGIPIIWLQDIAGFDVGLEAEKQGLLAYGSSLIYANSTMQTPFMTVLLRRASGAGYYAMAGLPYDPVIQLSTCLTRLAVMEGKTLALGAFKTRPGEKESMQVLADRIESDMDPFKSAGQMDTDEVIKLSEIRSYLECLVECCYQSQNQRRIKNPRIWSLHDLEAVMPAQAGIQNMSPPARDASAGWHDKSKLDSTPITGQAIRAPLEGMLYLRPSPTEPLFVEEGQVIQPGQTVALIEVMKCFHPIKYEGSKPEKVVKIHATDNQPIQTGAAILEFH
ncbi:MAG: propionyl-CoA carboxylase [Deltaproteobacteria bacterium]|nr:propionyl-CoA carboxylase [Deltaproteobacteria bacterium]